MNQEYEEKKGLFDREEGGGEETHRVKNVLFPTISRLEIRYVTMIGSTLTSARL